MSIHFSNFRFLNHNPTRYWCNWKNRSLFELLQSCSWRLGLGLPLTGMHVFSTRWPCHSLLSNLQPSYLRLTAEEWHRPDLLFHFSKHLPSLFPVLSSPPWTHLSPPFLTQTFPVLFGQIPCSSPVFFFIISSFFSEDDFRWTPCRFILLVGFFNTRLPLVQNKGLSDFCSPNANVFLIHRAVQNPGSSTSIVRLEKAGGSYCMKWLNNEWMISQISVNIDAKCIRCLASDTV